MTAQTTVSTISAMDPHPRRRMKVLDSEMSYVDVGQGDQPKLFINADPGSLIRERARAFCRTWRNQREITVKGAHFIQEDAPAEIGAALREFLLELRR